jgi:superfamily II helicase
MSDYTKITYKKAKKYIEEAHYEYLRECEFCDKEAEFENLIWYIDNNESIKYNGTIVCGFCNETCFNCWVLKYV